VAGECYLGSDRPAGWRSYLITCGVVKLLKGKVQADLHGLSRPAGAPSSCVCTVTLVSSLVVCSGLPVPLFAS